MGVISVDSFYYFTRVKAKALVDLLQEGDEGAALALLEEDKTLAWIRDNETGGYPIHIACWKVLYTEYIYSFSPGCKKEENTGLNTDSVKVKI